jgi:uncharacterized protein YggL (DUF469 family)
MRQTFIWKVTDKNNLNYEGCATFICYGGCVLKSRISQNFINSRAQRSFLAAKYSASVPSHNKYAKSLK